MRWTNRTFKMLPQVLVILLSFLSLAFGQGTDVEPNNTCASAQDLGAIDPGFTVEGSLDGADVDYFRFTGVPNAEITVDYEGEATGKGTLSDPLLGLFDSSCNLIDLNDDNGDNLNSRLTFPVPADGIFILAATSFEDFGFTGDGCCSGSYTLTITFSPIMFSEDRPCGDLPPEGGTCTYSIKVTNLSLTTFTGAAWSLVEGFAGEGEFENGISFTHFQTGKQGTRTPSPQILRLNPSRSRVLRFQFVIPSTVPDGALVCPKLFLGEDPHPPFDIVGQKSLFCLFKGFVGLRPVAGMELRRRLHQAIGKALQKP